MKIAVVTGGAGDIGRAIGLQLAKDGYTIAVADLRQDKSDAVVRELTDAGYSAFSAVVDITKLDTVERMAKDVLARGPVELVVNNAGVASAPTFETSSVEDWQAGLDINLNGAFYVTRQFLPVMCAARRGVVINISSGNGLVYAGAPAYSVAKAGLIHYTRMLAVEYGKFGIRALTVVPGSVRTQAWAHRLDLNPKLFDELRQWYPLGRVVEPVEVANVVAFAASDKASAMTGSCLTVDCGIMSGNTVLADLITAGDT